MPTNDWTARAQQASLDTALRRGELWTLAQVRELQEARDAGFSLSECAVLLERTYQAVSTMASLLARGDWREADFERRTADVGAYRGWTCDMGEE